MLYEYIVALVTDVMLDNLIATIPVSSAHRSHINGRSIP